MNSLLLVLIILVILSYLYFKIAERLNIIDKPNQRSSHTVPTIRGGGVLFYIAVLIFFLLNNFEYPYLFIGLTLLSVISFIDDIRSLSPNLRLIIHFLSIGLIIYESHIHDFGIIFSFAVLIPAIAVLNIYNFMDGINGITGLNAIVVILSLYLVNHYNEFETEKDLMVYMLLSILVFGFYNFRKKALFFAGDIGSISLAGLIIFLLIKSFVILKAPVLILLLGVYGVDATLTIVRRFKDGEKLSEAHRSHLYQVITDNTNTPHMVTALCYGLIQLILVIPILLLINAPVYIQIIVSIFVYLLLVVIHQIILKKIIFKKS